MNYTIHIRMLALAFMLSSVISIDAQEISLQFLGRYSTGIFDEGASEIVDYHAASQTIFSTNSNANSVDAIDVSDPANPVLAFTIDCTPYGGGVNSVAVLSTGIAVAVEAVVKQDPGSIVFFDFAGTFINQVTAGALPDMVTSTPDGLKLLVANEGEPNDDYTVDPLGTVSIIDISAGLASVTATDVTTLDFTAYNGGVPGARIFGPGATVAMDMEPEYIAVSPDNSTAWVVCQENNVLAIIDLTTDTWSSIAPLGAKDHSLPGNGIDASNRDGAGNDGVINIQNWPVQGFYMPDAADAYAVGGNTYVITANEGDSRDYVGYSEEERMDDLQYDLDDNGIDDDIDDDGVLNGSTIFYDDDFLGRLKTTSADGDIDNDGLQEVAYSYGARSFTIWDATGNLVWDSGDEFEQILSSELPDDFNSNNDENDSFDSRSDDKGPEPEAVEIAQIFGKWYAFIGLERVGGIMVYDVTNPSSPRYIQYINTRDFSTDLELNGTDSGVENIRFISAADSPSGNPMIAASNEVSGTVSLFEVDFVPYTLQVLHASDLEGGVDAIGRAKNFAALVDTLEGMVENSITLSAGDNYIPGPFFNAASDGSMRPIFQSVYQDLLGDPTLTNVREGVGRADISIMNIIGFDASAVGNHEFDAGPDAYESIIEEDVRFPGPDVRWIGARFPYLSANLDFSADGDLGNLYTSSILPNTDFVLDATYTNTSIPKIAPATTIMRDGEMIGVVGATAQILESITSTGGVSVIGVTTNDMPALAAILQPTIDQLTAMGVDKIVLVSHLQQIALEQALAGLLKDVDIIIAGGSDTILADANDDLDAGDTAMGTYPLQTVDMQGNPTLIVSTNGEYSYVGRLVVDFDQNGHIMVSSLDDVVNGVYVTSNAKVTELWGAADPCALGTKGELVQRLTDAVQAIVIAKDGNVFGETDVYLDGERSQVRSEETNMGKLTAEANLWFAQQVDPTVSVSLKNGGGIRAPIGEVVETSPGVFEFLPPQANTLSGKLAGQISQLDIENTLRFNNGLSAIDLSPSDLQAVLENGFSGAAPGSTPGAFPQVAGIEVVYDPFAPAGSKVFSAIIVDGTGAEIDVVIANGQIQGDPDRVIRVVTLNFLAGGGDSYPYPALGENRVDLYDLGLAAGAATFSDAGREQDALAEYLLTFHPIGGGTPFDQAETDPQDDQCIKIIGDIDSACEYAEQVSVVEFSGAAGYKPASMVAAATDIGCAGTQATRWYSFVANSPHDVIHAGVHPALGFASDGFDAVVEVWDACGGTSLGCFDNYGPNTLERVVVGSLVPGNTYYFSVQNAGPGEDFFTAVKSFAPHSLRPQYCGIMDYEMTDVIQAQRDDLGEVYDFVGVQIDGYAFQFSQGGSVVATIYQEGNIPFQIQLGQVPGLTTGGIYDVATAHRVPYGQNGSIISQWSPFGDTCPIALDPTVQSVQLSAADCGGTYVYGESNVISSTIAPTASAYQFRLTELNTGTIHEFVDNNYAILVHPAQMPGLVAGTYNVAVRARVGGAWGDYSVECPITVVNQAIELIVETEVDFNKSQYSQPLHEFKIYPNPNAGSQFRISIDELDGNVQTVNISIMDMNSKVLHMERFSNEGRAFDRLISIENSLAAGVYVVSILANDDLRTERLIIE